MVWCWPVVDGVNANHKLLISLDQLYSDITLDAARAMHEVFPDAVATVMQCCNEILATHQPMCVTPYDKFITCIRADYTTKHLWEACYRVYCKVYRDIAPPLLNQLRVIERELYSRAQHSYDTNPAEYQYVHTPTGAVLTGNNVVVELSSLLYH